MLEPEVRERGTKDRRKDGGEAIKQTKWEMSVELTHTEFREGELAEEAAWKAVVLIPKGRGDYRGIGIVEVMWKAVTVILNCHFAASITYYNSLHRFLAVRGMGAATL